jgi:hypothetical protein
MRMVHRRVDAALGSFCKFLLRCLTQTLCRRAGRSSGLEDSIQARRHGCPLMHYAWRWCGGAGERVGTANSRFLLQVQGCLLRILQLRF